MIEFILYFAIGFVISYCLVIYWYHKNEISHLLNTIKEDVVNLHLMVNNVLDHVKK